MKSPIQMMLMLCAVGLTSPAARFAIAADGETEQGASDKNTVMAGKGGYTLIQAPTKDKLPETVYVTEHVSGPLPSNNWYSSLHWMPFSSNMYAHPLAMKADKPGLRVSYPGPDMRVTKTNFEAQFKGDELLIGHSGTAEFSDARLDGFSDWFVQALFKNGENVLRTGFGHGSPFIYVHTSGGNPMARFASAPEIWSGKAGEAVLGLTIKGKHYALFGLAGSKWNSLDGLAFENVSGRAETYVSIALLPGKTSELLALFEKYAYSEVVGTKVSWAYKAEKATVETVFQFTTQSAQGQTEGTLFALYPHQWLNTAQTFLPYEYASIRGPMKLSEGKAFTTHMRFPGILPEIPAMPARSAETVQRLRSLVVESRAKKLGDPADTYWAGKPMDELSLMLPIVEQLGDNTAVSELLGNLKGRLEHWFTPPGAAVKKDHYFYYQRRWGTLIGQNCSYGSEVLNDHHFHYGYFIRAAAEIARLDPEWAAEKNWGGMVQLLIRDIASPSHKDEMFPFLRCFDPYAGHSWAGGSANNPSGNNQESVSEAINAWTGIFLWGMATGNKDLRDLGAYLYTTEVAASDCYWFDVEKQFFPKGYERSCAVLVFGGASAYATWFSGKPEHCHGIILVPIQSGSLYLGLHPNYVKRNLDALVALAGSEKLDWMEVFSSYQALIDPEKALQWFDAPSTKIDAEKRARTYHWITALKELGRVDAEVTADYPEAMAFTKNGKRAYIVYNYMDTPLSVLFSDGTKVDAGHKGVTLK